MQRFVFFLLLSLFVSVQMYSQPVEPILRLTSDFHHTTIRSISTDAQGRYALTASEDKTARLWDARTGNAIRTFHPPVGYGREGMLYASALSPDGKTAAVGGCTGGTWNKTDSFRITVGGWQGYARQLRYSIYLFSTVSGELLLNIDRMEGEIQYLCFSANGEYLAVALGENKGIYILNAKDGTEVRRLTGYGATVVQMAFSRSGKLAAIADDQQLRLYSETFQLMFTHTVEGKPASVAFSSDESTIAIGKSGQSQIDLYHLTEGYKFQTSVLMTPPNSSTPAVAFSPNGILYSGECMQNGENRIVAWKNETRTEILHGAGKITNIHALSDGSIVYATSFPETGRILPDHQPPPAWEGKKEKAYLRTSGRITLTQPEFFQLSDDGSIVGLANAGKEILYFSLSERALNTAPSYLPKPVNSLRERKLSVTGWKDSHALFLNGKSLPVLDTDEINQCVDISGNGRYILLGTNRHLICLDAAGRIIWKRQVAEGCVALKIAGNERVAVIALADGTYAWYNMIEGERLLTLFVHPDQRRWMVWTPAGFYDCSTGAEDIAGWNLNQGKNKASVFYPLSQFRERYYRPVMIDRSIGYRLGQIAQNDQNQDDGKSQSIFQTLPPEINILSPQTETSVSDRKVKLQYSVYTQKNSPVESVRALVNGRPVQLLSSVHQGVNELSLEIPEEDCEIALIARNKFASSIPATVKLKWTGLTEENIFKPKLYILAVGISKYNDRNLGLRFAAKDARDFANIMSRQKGFLYGDVSIQLLTDDKSTRANILDGLDWIQSETTSRDVAMIFFAGHGINDNTGNFYYMPVEADRERLRSTCVNYTEIKQSVADIAGKIILFMDACHSGNILGSEKRSATGPTDIIGFIKDLADAENGAVVFTSSTGKQYSLEDPKWDNGAFTKALVEGIEGKADFLNRHIITIKTLDVYITQRVKELTKGQQAPTTIIPASITDFPIAVSR